MCLFEAPLQRAGLFPCSMDIFDALWGHGVETLRPQQSRQPAMEVQPALKQERTWKQAVQLARAREQRAHGRVRKVATKQSEVLSKAVSELKCRGGPFVPMCIWLSGDLVAGRSDGRRMGVLCNSWLGIDTFEVVKASINA